MGIDFDVFAGLKTDDLKAELAVMREDLMGRQTSYAEEMFELETAVNDLKKMEEKTTFVVTQLEQIAVLTTPPPKSGAEEASDALDRYFTDPVFLASTGLGAVGGVVVLSKPVIKLIGMVPKLGKATKLANSSKFLKVMKLGKGTLLLGAAIAIVELAVGMISSQEINKQLRKDKAELNRLTREADKEIGELSKATTQAKGLVTSLLKDAGLGDLAHGQAMESYVRMMNEAIGALSAQKAKVRMVRKMVMHGAMTAADIASITGVDETVVESVSQRVAVERALVSGKTVVEAARDSLLDDAQIIEIDKTVRARNEAIAGEPAESVAMLLDVPVSVVLSEGEENLPVLEPFWGHIEKAENLDAISEKVLISADALARLSAELQSKAALAAGDDPAAVGQAHGHSIEHVGEWAVEIADARTRIAILKRDAKLRKLEKTAVQLRMPLSIAA
ncbi:MAG: hypothetical protein AAGI10_00345 [Pseudomonadota bacterium]